MVTGMSINKAAVLLYMLTLVGCSSSGKFLGDIENVKTSNDVKTASSWLIPKYEAHCGKSQRPITNYDQWYECKDTTALIAESLILAGRYTESAFYVTDAAKFWSADKDSSTRVDNACDSNVLTSSYGIYGAYVRFNYNQSATLINEKTAGALQQSQLILAYLCALPETSDYRSIILERTTGAGNTVIPEQFARFLSKSNMLEDLERHFGASARAEAERYFNEIDSVLKPRENKAYLKSIGSEHNPNADVMVLYTNALTYAKDNNFSAPYIKYLELRVQEAARYAGAN